MSLGQVALVGAGPGEADLLTLRAVRRLGEADLVLYDALAAPDLRALAPEARWFFVGKRARRESITQEAINRILIREARRGHNVVRLKCGDPFVLGRGGEEALALADAGIPYEIVPGLSSSLAGPGLAGIPVTHRGLASGFTVLAGHSPSAYGPVVDSLLPGSTTLIVLMGLGARAEIAARLLARGWPCDLEAAIVAGAATPDSWRWVGTLAALETVELPAQVAAAGPPALLVVGKVVALAERLAPVFGAKPLADAAGESPESRNAAR